MGRQGRRSSTGQNSVLRKNKVFLSSLQAIKQVWARKCGTSSFSWCAPKLGQSWNNIFNISRHIEDVFFEATSNRSRKQSLQTGKIKVPAQISLLNFVKFTFKVDRLLARLAYFAFFPPSTSWEVVSSPALPDVVNWLLPWTN